MKLEIRQSVEGMDKTYKIYDEAPIQLSFISRDGVVDNFGNISLDQLQYIMKSYADIMSRMGTDLPV